MHHGNDSAWAPSWLMSNVELVGFCPSISIEYSAYWNCRGLAMLVLPWGRKERYTTYGKERYTPRT